MADAARARKLAERIQQIVADMLETRIKDPRLGFVTVTDVRVASDLHLATVFYTVYGDEEAAAGTAAALESAKGIIRSEVGKHTGVKFTPAVEFVRDALPGTVKAIDDLLARAQAQDRAVSQQAQAGHFAGDADPYRNDEQ